MMSLECKSESSPRKETARFDLKLQQPTEDFYNAFNYKKLLSLDLKNEEVSYSAVDTPYDDVENTHERFDDYEEESYIDNSELFPDSYPKGLKPKHKGFFVNSGKLKLAPILSKTPVTTIAIKSNPTKNLKLKTKRKEVDKYLKKKGIVNCAPQSPSTSSLQINKNENYLTISEFQKDYPVAILCQLQKPETVANISERHRKSTIVDVGQRIESQEAIEPEILTIEDVCSKNNKNARKTQSSTQNVLKKVNRQLNVNRKTTKVQCLESKVRRKPLPKGNKTVRKTTSTKSGIMKKIQRIKSDEMEKKGKEFKKNQHSTGEVAVKTQYLKKAMTESFEFQKQSTMESIHKFKGKNIVLKILTPLEENPSNLYQPPGKQANVVPQKIALSSHECPMNKLKIIKLPELQNSVGIQYERENLMEGCTELYQSKQNYERKVHQKPIAKEDSQHRPGSAIVYQREGNKEIKISKSQNNAETQHKNVHGMMLSDSFKLLTSSNVLGQRKENKKISAPPVPKICKNAQTQNSEGKGILERTETHKIVSNLSQPQKISSIFDCEQLENKGKVQVPAFPKQYKLVFPNETNGILTTAEIQQQEPINVWDHYKNKEGPLKHQKKILISRLNDLKQTKRDLELPSTALYAPAINTMIKKTHDNKVQILESKKGGLFQRKDPIGIPRITKSLNSSSSFNCLNQENVNEIKRKLSVPNVILQGGDKGKPGMLQNTTFRANLSFQSQKGFPVTSLYQPKMVEPFSVRKHTPSTANVNPTFTLGKNLPSPILRPVVTNLPGLETAAVKNTSCMNSAPPTLTYGKTLPSPILRPSQPLRADLPSLPGLEITLIDLTENGD